MIWEEEEGFFIFQFKDVEVKYQMLHLLEVWVAVRGLGILMRNEKALARIRHTPGEVVCVDHGAVHRKGGLGLNGSAFKHELKTKPEASVSYFLKPKPVKVYKIRSSQITYHRFSFDMVTVTITKFTIHNTFCIWLKNIIKKNIKVVNYKVRVRQDVQQKFWPRPRFEFSPLVLVTDELQYEKVHGLYAACGMLGWWRLQEADGKVVGGVGHRSTSFVLGNIELVLVFEPAGSSKSVPEADASDDNVERAVTAHEFQLGELVDVLVTVGKTLKKRGHPSDCCNNLKASKEGRENNAGKGLICDSKENKLEII
ncbi:hypothetical protein ACLB2K_022972 [Fragaria x ananassa]